jgi:Predicted pyridoxal phosphate-dependent enzyme apparently involved in regulation of cell wall biogenesis
LSSAPDFIPQTNPLASYLAHKDEINEAIDKVLRKGQYILGEEAKQFEDNFGLYLHGAQVVGTGSGTDAIHLALLVCGIGQNDVVVTVSHTAVATVAAIHLAGAKAAFVDIDPVTFTMSPQSLEELLPVFRRNFGSRLKAILPVHLYGNPADMKRIKRIADSHELIVIEDCAQSHGAEIDSKKTGTWGIIGAFSFYPTKNLAAIGDGGAIVTSNAELSEKAKFLREYGWKERYISSEYGMNTRLDELQAAILNVKLKYLDQEIKRRREIADLYDSLLTEFPITIPSKSSVYHQYVICVENRDSLRQHLQKDFIGTAIHYPLPVHLQPAYLEESIPYRKNLMETEKVCRQILSLPLYPELENSKVIRVGEQIRKWFNQH